MKYLLRPAVAFVLLLTIYWHAVIGFTQGTAFTYQGNLNVSGTSANGSYDLTFTLFSSSNAIGQLGDTLTNLNTGVTNGLFAVALDFGPGIFTGSNVWLQLGVRTNGGTVFTTLAPLQAITPSPYAIFANTASNLLGTLSAAQLSGTLTNNTTGNAATATTATYASSAMTAATATNAINAQTVTGSQSNAIAVSYFTTNSAYKNAYMSGNPDYTTWPDGWNSWYDTGEAVSESTITNAVNEMKTNGLLACGLSTISMDGGDFTNRDANGIPMMDATKFPHGFPWLCNYIITNGFKVGIYGVVTTNAGLSGDVHGDYYFYGAEAAGANYFLTNGVTYFKFDAPIPPVYGSTNGWPNLYDFKGNLVTPFGINDIYDQSYLTFATLCRRKPQPVFFNASHYFQGNQYGANITTLLNSWRFTGMPATNSLGQSNAGDITGPWQELFLWNWISLAAQGLPPQGGWEFPDFDTFNSQLMPGFWRHMYASAEFGSIFQTDFASDGTGFNYHSYTNELSNSLLKTIRARGTIPHFAYATNGCYIYTKDNLQGGLDVLVENENYNAYSGGSGSSGGSEGNFGRWSESVLTNYYTYNSGNYYYQFYATNAVLDFGKLGLSSTNCEITTLCLNKTATMNASGSLPVFVMAAGANLYTINPVNSFPISSAPTVSLYGLPWFNFWSSNTIVANPANCVEPAFETQNITGPSQPTVLQGGSMSYYPINGAASFQCLCGVDTGQHFAIGSSQYFYVDGSLVATTMVWTASGQYTNISFAFNPTNQYLEIQNFQQTGSTYALAEMQGAQFNFTNNNNYSGSFAGNGGGLTGLNASALASGTVPLAQIPVQVVTNNSSNITLDAPAFLGGWTNIGGTIYNSGAFTNGGDLGIGGNEIVAGNLTIESGGVFSGNASGATSLNASALSSGTIPPAVLPASVPTNTIITTANGLTNSYSLSGNILSIAIGQTNSWPVTNAMAGRGTVNAALPVTTCFTNASFTFAQPVNVQMNGYSQPVIEVRNSGGTPITITPGPGWHPLPNSVWVCTNESMVSLFIYPGLETNANCTPVR